VESGTFQGKTTSVESRFFDQVHTIELNPELYEAATKRFKDTPNVTCHFGDSVEVLGKLVVDLHAPAVFYLDAHWSGDSKVDWDGSTWSGYGVDTAFRGDTWPPSPEQQCPLVEESRIIGSAFKPRAIVVVDDWSVVGTKDKYFKGEDWSTISEEAILNALGRDRIIDSFVSVWDDKPRMVIVLDEKK
jgi:hypothetical protein